MMDSMTLLVIGSKFTVGFQLTRYMFVLVDFLETKVMFTDFQVDGGYLGLSLKQSHGWTELSLPYWVRRIQSPVASRYEGVRWGQNSMGWVHNI